MPTVIDSLILQLNLDPSGFEKGQKDAATAFIKTKDEAVKSGKAIEDQGKKTALSINQLTTRVLELYAVFLSGRGLKEFITDTANATAAIGRLAAALGTSPQDLSAFTQAVERSGGTAEQAAGSYAKWSDALQQLKLSGKALPEEFYRLQAQGGKMIDTNHGVTQSILDIADNLKNVAKVNPAQANLWGRALGFDQDTVLFLEQGSAAVKAALDKSSAIGVATAEQVKAAQELQSAWRALEQSGAALGRSLMAAVSPAITQALKDIVDNLDKLRIDPQIATEWDDLGKSVGKLASALNLPSESAFFKTLDSQIKLAISDLKELIDTLTTIASFVAPKTEDVVKDMQAGQAAGPFDWRGWLKRFERTPSPTVPTRGLTLGGGKDIGGLERAEDPIFGAGRGGGPPEAQPIKVGGSEVSSGNPLPVTIASHGPQSLWEWLTGGAGSGAGGATRNVDVGGGDTRTWWQRHAPRSLGGQDAPTGEGGGTGGQHPTGKWWTPDRIQHAADRLIKEAGLSPEGAAGLVARWSAIEAAGGPDSRNPRSGAQGIAQWLGTRKQGMGSTFDEQISHAIGELKGDESRAARQLRGAKTPREGAIGASMFERAEGYNARSGTDNFTNSTPAEKIFGLIKGSQPTLATTPQSGKHSWLSLPPGSVGAGGAPSAAMQRIANDNRQTSTSTSSSEMHIQAMNIYSNAKDADGIARDIQPALERQYASSQSNYGPA